MIECYTKECGRRRSGKVYNPREQCDELEEVIKQGLIDHWYSRRQSDTKRYAYELGMVLELYLHTRIGIDSRSYRCQSSAFPFQHEGITKKENFDCDTSQQARKKA